MLRSPKPIANCVAEQFQTTTETLSVAYIAGNVLTESVNGAVIESARVNNSDPPSDVPTEDGVQPNQLLNLLSCITLSVYYLTFVNVIAPHRASTFGLHFFRIFFGSLRVHVTTNVGALLLFGYFFVCFLARDDPISIQRPTRTTPVLELRPNTRRNPQVPLQVTGSNINFRSNRSR